MAYSSRNSHNLFYIDDSYSRHFTLPWLRIFTGNGELFTLGVNTMPKRATATPSSRHEDETLKVLLEVSQSLYQYLNIDDLILHIIRLIRNLLKVEAASVILHDEKKNEFVFRWLQDERIAAQAKLKAMRFPVNQGIAGSVFSSGKPEIIHNTTRDSRHFKNIDQLTESKTRSGDAIRCTGIRWN